MVDSAFSSLDCQFAEVAIRRELVSVAQIMDALKALRPACAGGVGPKTLPTVLIENRAMNLAEIDLVFQDLFAASGSGHQVGLDSAKVEEE